ncbi:protein kinase domain-containing protein [Thermococcus sp.]
MKTVTVSEEANGRYWIKRYELEGIGNDINAVALTPNRDIVCAGEINYSKSSGLVFRLDREGNAKWVRILGGGDYDGFNDVKIAPNGDIIVAGYTKSFGAGDEDVWVLRLDANGNVKWQKTYGGKYGDYANAVAIASNGDIIVAGYTDSFGAGGAWVLRLDANGNVKWQKTYGGSGYDEATTIAIAPNGDIIVAGYTDSFSADDFDFWVLRLDENGNVKWQKTYGGSNSDEAYAIAVADNGDIIVAGWTKSFGVNAEKWAYIWVLRLDENGNVKWQKAYGGSNGWDEANAVAVANNGDIIMVGYYSGNVWVLRLDSEGNIKWQKIPSGTSHFNSLALTPEGDIIAVGGSAVAKIPPDGELPNCDLWKDTNAIMVNTKAIVKSTKCEVKDENAKISTTTATIRTVIPNVKVLYEWSMNKKQKRTGTSHSLNKLIELAILSAKHNNASKLVKYLEDLKLRYQEYSGKHKDELESAILQFRYMLNEGIPISQEGVEKLEILLKMIEMEMKILGAENAKEDKFLLDSKPITTPEVSTESEEPTERGNQELSLGMASEIPVEEIKTPEGFLTALLSRYEPLEFLGEGGFAKVFKVKRRDDGKVVALKIPRIDERTSSLFIKEVAAWYNLNHDNIVRLYKADILPVPYLEMEFVEGVEVNGKLVRDLDAYPKPVDEKTALKLIMGIAKGLKHAHDRGIYHLDLKPLNVLLKGDLTPKITDWGLARISARGALDGVRGYSIGYAAPEQLDEETFGMSDHRTDIYQLGLIFYELLTGRPPYPGVTPYNIEMKILSKDTKPRPPSYFNSALAKYDGIFEKLLAKKKEDRYQSVEEFLSALESLGKLKREKEDLRKTTLAMKRSKSREEFERLKIKSIRQTVAIAVLSAKLNDKALLLEALDDLRFHTRENFDDLVNLIAQVEMLIREGIPISGSLAEKIEVLVRRIEGEVLR